MAEPNQVPPSHTPKPSPTPVPPTSGPLTSLEALLYNWFVYRAPYQLPVGITGPLVQYGPWITLVLGIIALPVLLGALTFLSLFTAAAVYGYHPGVLYWLGILILLVQIIVMFVSIPMLLRRQRKGWLLLFYAEFINIAYGLVSAFAYAAFGLGTLIGTLIGAVVILYVLFQIRSYYTK